MLMKRQMDFLRELIKTTSYYPARHYANLLNVSVRTIHIDLDILVTVVTVYNLSIKRV